MKKGLKAFAVIPYFHLNHRASENSAHIALPKLICVKKVNQKQQNRSKIAL